MHVEFSNAIEIHMQDQEFSATAMCQDCMYSHISERYIRGVVLVKRDDESNLS